MVYSCVLQTNKRTKAYTLFCTELQKENHQTNQVTKKTELMSFISTDALIQTTGNKKFANSEAGS